MGISANEESTKPTEKSIRFSLVVHDKLQKLSAKLGRPQTLVFSQMVDYFYRTKKDPIDLNDEMLKNSILKNAQSQIAFLKTQEKIFLFPMNEKIGEVLEQQGEILEALNEQVLQANQAQEEQHKNQLQYLKGIYTKTENMVKQLEEKTVLKSKFIYILNSYINAREKISGLFNGKEKDELIEETIKQIKRL